MEMGKYEPLGQHLERSGKLNIPLTFEEIEAIIDSALPVSARKYPAWWSNNPTGHVNSAAWLGAGYKATKVNIEAEELVFHKPVSSPTTKSTKKPRRHPLFGSMKGTVTVEEGYDLTSPSEAIWNAQTE
ncbi:MAG: hypothetical protein GXP03_05120 [Alphaproteobacteria bacterium]|nr:hypothetical protein [Alphaproteobacteria bacterium]